MEEKIREILDKSKEVFLRCCLPNGAIIASDVFNPMYPNDVKWYGFVWTRDASFVCYAADLLKLHEIPEKFYRWCWERAEGLKENGVFLSQKYYPNGRIAGDADIGIKISELRSKRAIGVYKTHVKVKLHYYQFQPDQTSSVLWSIYEHSKFKDVEEFKDMIVKMADGICACWKKNCFKIPSYDLWEEKVALPSLHQVHTYSLAMCIKGLECASALTNKKERWKNVIKQMKGVLEKCYVKKYGFFVKTYGDRIDKTIDTSALGLVWPSEQFSPKDERIQSTVNKILERNEIKGGIYRYPKNKYDGKIKFGDLELGGAGAWPILNYWISIYFSLKGEREKALRYFNWVNIRVKDYIPEQIKDDKPASIIPLAWSHAMFVIAAKFLKII